MWQDRTWARREDRKMEFRVQATSAGREWSGFEATIYAASAGYSELAPSNHSVSMQLGRPVMVTSRCDGATLHRLQRPGDVKIVPANVARVWETESATVKLSMDVTPALLFSTAESLGIRNAAAVTVAPQLHVADPRIEHIGWAVKAELESHDSMGRLFGEGLGIALATQLLRRYARVPSQRIETLSHRRVARAIEYIRTNLAADLSLFELAQFARLSPTHFKTMFKRATGMPVHQYVLRTRVEFAARSLQRGDGALADVALQAGFANQSHLARCMRRVLGVTPGQVRTRARI
jgi:AraC family transcriptional regulator